VVRHTHGPQKRGRQTSTHSGTSRGGGFRQTTHARVTRGGGVRPHLSVSMSGEGDLGEYKILNSAVSSSVSESCSHNWKYSILEVKCTYPEFEKPTSAPLTASVVAITPVPLLYHVRTFYIVRYNSPATHPSQPTYTFNKIQNKRNKGGLTKDHTNTHTNKHTNKRTNKQKLVIYIITLV